MLAFLSQVETKLEEVLTNLKSETEKGFSFMNVYVGKGLLDINGFRIYVDYENGHLNVERRESAPYMVCTVTHGCTHPSNSASATRQSSDENNWYTRRNAEPDGLFGDSFIELSGSNGNSDRWRIAYATHGANKMLVIIGPDVLGDSNKK
jgi:hypothetical protein